MGELLKSQNLSVKDNSLWIKFMDIVKKDLSNKLSNVNWSVTMEIKFSDLDSVDMIRQKLKRVKIKGKEIPLFNIEEGLDRFTVKYIVEAKNR